MSTTSIGQCESAPALSNQLTQSPSISSHRIHYLDNLRALAMLLGVYLHAALAYAEPARFVWLATDSQGSKAVDISIWFIHLFRMGLFFLLSGYFANLVTTRKGVKQFLWNRFLRVVVPFVLFYPFLLAAMTVVIVFALSYLEQPQGLMGLISDAVKNSSGPQKSQPLTTMHLWFLYYLAAFSVIAALFYRAGFRRLDNLLRQPLVLSLCPLLLVPAAMYAGSPLPAPESFVLHWWPFAFYGLFFFAGWRLFNREFFIESMCPYVWHFVGLSALLFIPYYLLMPTLDLRQLNQLKSGAFFEVSWPQIIEAVLTAYLAVLLTIVSLVLGKRYLARRSALLSFVADSSYWIYLLHLPIVLFLQSLLVPAALPLVIKLAIVLIGTTIPCMATYVVFVRYTPIGWLLHGKRSFP